MKKVIHLLQGIILGAGLVMLGLFISVQFLSAYLTNSSDILFASLVLPFIPLLFFTSKKMWWLAGGVCVGTGIIVALLLYAQGIAANCPNGVCVTVQTAPSSNN